MYNWISKYKQKDLISFLNIKKSFYKELFNENEFKDFMYFDSMEKLLKEEQEALNERKSATTAKDMDNLARKINKEKDIKIKSKLVLQWAGLHKKLLKEIDTSEFDNRRESLEKFRRVID